MFGEYRVYYGKELIVDGDDLDKVIDWFQDMIRFYKKNGMPLQHNVSLVSTRNKKHYALAYVKSYDFTYKMIVD